MGKAVTRGQALELVGQFSRETNWDALSSEGVQAIIDLSPEERTARFTAFLKNGARLTVVNGAAADTVSKPALKKFAAWRTFRIGGVSKKDLLKRVESSHYVSDWAKDLMKRPQFTTQEAEEEIETIILTPADLGFTEMPTTSQLLDPGMLAQWSKQNPQPPSGYAVELLPAEAGPHIRDQYKDQPNGEVLWMAMERIADSDGGPSVFTVRRDTDGGRWLHADWAFPDGQWNLDSRVAFRLRKVTQD